MKKRLDVLLFEQGKAESREKAKALGGKLRLGLIACNRAGHKHKLQSRIEGGAVIFPTDHVDAACCVKQSGPEIGVAIPGLPDHNIADPVSAGNRMADLKIGNVDMIYVNQSFHGFLTGIWMWPYAASSRTGS